MLIVTRVLFALVNALIRGSLHIHFHCAARLSAFSLPSSAVKVRGEIMVSSKKNPKSHLQCPIKDGGPPLPAFMLEMEKWERKLKQWLRRVLLSQVQTAKNRARLKPQILIFVKMFISLQIGGKHFLQVLWLAALLREETNS